MMNILLVDDQEIDRELIKHTLFSSGKNIEITEASNAHEGISNVENTQFDVILMDYQMPKMNGIEMLVALKQKQTIKNAAIIMMSHNTSEDIMLECIDAGAQDFLLKEEVTSSQLLRSIRQSRKRFELEAKLSSSYLQVKDLAEHDQLTGLYNRYHFEDTLSALLVNSRALKGHVVVMLMDLDNFKHINDSFGHAVGDKLLIQLAHRVKSHFRESKLFARLGGDEFGFIFTGVKKIEQTFIIANRILSNLELPFQIDGHTIYCSGSIGMSINSAKSDNIEELIKYADIAMYQAKTLGRNQACLFENNMELDFYRAYKIEGELREAIKKQDFVMHYQPIYQSNDHRLIGFEALIRWPEGPTTQNPEEFIPIAEQSRLIEPLGRWILEETIEQIAKWNRALDTNLSLAINLSPLQIHDQNLMLFIKELLEKHQVNPANIILEITETALLSDHDTHLEALKTLTSFGCGLALDDFGTGYSSIAHLLNFPIDIVKFDKTLIDGASCNSKSAFVLQGLTEMLQNMEIITVAEGVETVEQVEMCEKIKIDRLQGYYLSRPMPVAQCEQLLLIDKKTILRVIN